jgi:hypothetical protein
MGLIIFLANLESAGGSVLYGPRHTLIVKEEKSSPLKPILLTFPICFQAFSNDIGIVV